MFRNIYLANFAVFLTLTNSAFSEEMACQQIVKKCFSEEGMKKSNCFYRASQDKECENTETGKVTYKRWTLSGAPTDGNTQAFLGPIGVDLSCTLNCDNQWLAFIIADESTKSTADHVTKCLDSCKTEDTLQLPRP